MFGPKKGLKELHKEVADVVSSRKRAKDLDNETRDHTSRQRPVFIQGV